MLDAKQKKNGNSNRRPLGQHLSEKALNFAASEWMAAHRPRRSFPPGRVMSPQLGVRSGLFHPATTHRGYSSGQPGARSGALGGPLSQGRCAAGYKSHAQGPRTRTTRGRLRPQSTASSGCCRWDSRAVGRRSRLHSEGMKKHGPPAHLPPLTTRVWFVTHAYTTRTACAVTQPPG